MSRRILLAAPPLCELAEAGSSHATFLLLPHPRHSQPAYYLPHPAAPGTPQLLELLKIAPSSGARSWFLTPDEEAETPATALLGEGEVVRDGALHLLAPIDPLFLLLPILSTLQPWSELPYLPPDDLFERCASLCGAELARQHNASMKEASARQKDKSRQMDVELVDEDTEWEDVGRFGALDFVQRRLMDLCDRLDVSPTLTTVRPSKARTIAALEVKLSYLSSAATFDAAPTTLGRQLARALDADATDEERAAARRRIASDTLGDHVCESWLAELAAHTEGAGQKEAEAAQS